MYRDEEDFIMNRWRRLPHG